MNRIYDFPKHKHDTIINDQVKSIRNKIICCNDSDEEFLFRH